MSRQTSCFLLPGSFRRRSVLTTIRVASTLSTEPGRCARTTYPESRATIASIPVPKVKNKCLLVGPFSKIDDPDLVLIFCTPQQADILVRVYAYLGELFEGFGGSGGCLFNIRHAYYKRVPTFSTSDLSWRMFIGLNENELTVTMPYERLAAIAPYIKDNVEYVNNFLSMF